MSEYFPATCPVCYARVMNVYAQAHSEWHERLDQLLLERAT